MAVVKEIFECIPLLFFLTVMYGGFRVVSWACRETNEHVIQPLKSDVKTWQLESAAKYGRLDTSGKLRSDIRTAKITQFVGTFGWGIAALTAIAITPLAWIPAVITGQWALRNWKEQQDAISVAQQRRAEILRS